MQWRNCSLFDGGIQLLTVLLAVLHFCTLSAGQSEGDVRLVGGTGHQGTVEVFHEGEWGTICDDSWNRVWYRAHYGQGQGPIWVDQIDCPQGATRITQCNPTPDNWGIHDCRKTEDAGVDCRRQFPVKPSSMAVRVSCPDCVQWGSCSACPTRRHSSPDDCTNLDGVQGIVFAQYNDEWHPVTGDGWDIKDSQVVCAELGYPVALPPPSLASLWTNWNGNFLNRCGRLNGLFTGPTYPSCQDKDPSSSGGGSGGEGLIDAGLCTQSEIAGNNAFRSLLGKTLLKGVACDGHEKRLLDCYFPVFGPFEVQELNVATVKCAFTPHPSCPNSSPEVSFMHELLRYNGRLSRAMLIFAPFVQHNAYQPQQHHSLARHNIILHIDISITISKTMLAKSAKLRHLPPPFSIILAVLDPEGFP